MNLKDLKHLPGLIDPITQQDYQIMLGQCPYMRPVLLNISDQVFKRQYLYLWINLN